jgi:exopolysaccharide biosynthesis polyprenyl glycosylphosphotransferase
MVGTSPQALDLARLINGHPEAGYTIIGRCGPGNESDTANDEDGPPLLGGYSDAVRALTRTGADGALVVAGAMPPGQLNRTVRQLMRSGTHVHLSSGMSGIAHDRLIPLPVAREPLFYLERTSLTRSQLTLKRALDVTLGSALVIVLAPVALLAALAVKVADGGPVLFRQERVGRGGRHFTLYKLRTMVPDAEQRVIDLTDANDRRGGPLFKLRHDPRVTRVGRFLRATSIDELPQLVNVVRGDMSLVGPRPALPTEVTRFDDELRQRGRVLPGITGLWQVEARDDPSFASYRRLDLYYVENWSIGLDLAILAATVGTVIMRGGRLLCAGARDR